MNADPNADRNNRSRQLNPQDEQYWLSRGLDPHKQAEDAEFDYTENDHYHDEV